MSQTFAMDFENDEVRQALDDIDDYGIFPIDDKRISDIDEIPIDNGNVVEIEIEKDQFNDGYINENNSSKFKRISNISSGIDGIDLNIRNHSETQNTQKDVELTPPENFSPVIGNIYRSSFPRSENFHFLSSLKLKTILMLVSDELPEENIKFIETEGINLYQVGMSGNKEPFVKIPDDVLTKALEIAINPDNHPLLIHCNRGKHRTGCLVGCIRRLQSWSLIMILDEYRRFAAPKIRPLDQQFIEMYDDEEIVKKATDNGWLPLKW